MRLFGERWDTGGLLHGRLAGAVLALLLLAGCDQVFQDHTKRSLDIANKKYAEGDFKGAAQYYEDALDGTAETADTHYKLGLLFDDKFKNPLAATYHFQRYLELKPSGPHAKEAKSFIQEDQLKIVTALSRGALMSQEDAARLKNDNLALRKQNAELYAQLHAASRPQGQKGTDPQPGGGPAKSLPPGARTYEVQHGDTLASIARKFYKSSTRWKDIEDANFNTLSGKAKLKPGMILIIPK